MIFGRSTPPAISSGGTVRICGIAREDVGTDWVRWSIGCGVGGSYWGAA